MPRTNLASCPGPDPLLPFKTSPEEYLDVSVCHCHRLGSPGEIELCPQCQAQSLEQNQMKLIKIVSRLHRPNLWQEGRAFVSTRERVTMPIAIFYPFQEGGRMRWGGWLFQELHYLKPMSTRYQQQNNVSSPCFSQESALPPMATHKGALIIRGNDRACDPGI